VIFFLLIIEELLHGRTEFDPNSGHRHLQGYYMDRDEIIGRLNYLKK
jgi:gamma-butyrobetaine dioxygenase